VHLLIIFNIIYMNIKHIVFELNFMIVNVKVIILDNLMMVIYFITFFSFFHFRFIWNVLMLILSYGTFSPFLKYMCFFILILVTEFFCLFIIFCYLTKVQSFFISSMLFIFLVNLYCEVCWWFNFSYYVSLDSS